MKHSLYDKSRLTSVNVLGYISEQYPKSKMINKEKEKMLNITSFQQSLFGKKGDGDCTLVSLMTCLYYYLKEEIDKTLLYDAIRSKAEKRFFSEKIGLLPFFTLGLYKKLLKQFSLKHSAKSAWFKGIGYNFNTIKKCIDNNIPVVLSITNDGRGYYKNHSVTVVGYRAYKADNKEIKMLILYDNWAFSESLLDYNKLSVLSAIYF